MHRISRQYWIRTERNLLLVFLTCKACLFVRFLGVRWGYDINAFMDVVDATSWRHPLPPIRELFYAYHPPLSFLLVRTLQDAGFSQLMSGKLMALASSLATFFFVRATLKYARLLDKPAAIAFLYMFASIPMQMFLTTAVSIDGLILTFTAAALYFCIRLHWRPDESAPLSLKIGVTTILTLALYTKFSGVLLLSVPVLTALLAPRNEHFKAIVLRASKAGMLSLIAVALAFPMYHSRYYASEGEYFPSNLKWLRAEQMERARDLRDEDRLHFVVSLFLPRKSHAIEDLRASSRDTPRLIDTWIQLWLRDEYHDRIKALPPVAEPLAQSYLLLAHFVFLCGLALFFRQLKNPGLWERLGAVLLLMACAQIILQLAFIYGHPFAAWSPTKAIYVTPLLLAVGYFMANSVSLAKQRRLAAFAPFIERGFMLCLCIIIVLNHALPAY